MYSIKWSAKYHGSLAYLCLLFIAKIIFLPCLFFEVFPVSQVCVISCFEKQSDLGREQGEEKTIKGLKASTEDWREGFIVLSVTKPHQGDY